MRRYPCISHISCILVLLKIPLYFPYLMYSVLLKIPLYSHISCILVFLKKTFFPYLMYSCILENTPVFPISQVFLYSWKYPCISHISCILVFLINTLVFPISHVFLCSWSISLYFPYLMYSCFLKKFILCLFQNQVNHLNNMFLIIVFPAFLKFYKNEVLENFFCNFKHP